MFFLSRNPGDRTMSESAVSFLYTLSERQYDYAIKEWNKRIPRALNGGIDTLALSIEKMLEIFQQWMLYQPEEYKQKLFPFCLRYRWGHEELVFFTSKDSPVFRLQEQGIRLYDKLSLYKDKEGSNYQLPFIGHREQKGDLQKSFLLGMVPVGKSDLGEWIPGLWGEKRIFCPQGSKGSFLTQEKIGERVAPVQFIINKKLIPAIEGSTEVEEKEKSLDSTDPIHEVLLLLKSLREAMTEEALKAWQVSPLRALFTKKMESERVAIDCLTAKSKHGLNSLAVEEFCWEHLQKALSIARACCDSWKDWAELFLKRSEEADFQEKEKILCDNKKNDFQFEEKYQLPSELTSWKKRDQALYEEDSEKSQIERKKREEAERKEEEFSEQGKMRKKLLELAPKIAALKNLSDGGFSLNEYSKKAEQRKEDKKENKNTAQLLVV